MATVNFLTGGGSFAINNLAGSGLGFYGAAGFGASVAVGSFQNTTFVTDSTGTLQGPQTWNVQWFNQGSGAVGGASSGIALTAIPNFQAQLNIRFNNGTAVHTQNAKVQIYDRYSISNPASGVTTKMAEAIHPDTVQTNNGSGSTVWTHASGVAAATGVALLLHNNPCTSGLGASAGNGGADTQHDYYILLSASPDTIGAKTQYALYFYVEYL